MGCPSLKNQFFADKHDYFKYDLWLEVGEKLGGIRSLTFIPMLTPSDSTKEGRKITYVEGRRRKRLYGFLQFCLVPKRRSIARLREFLCDEPFEYHPYRDEDDKGFQDGSWAAYFSAIPHEWLRDAAILIDPDTGIETKTGKDPKKHVTCENIKNILSRCSGNSVVLVVQFLIQGNAHLREKQLGDMGRGLQERLRSVESYRGPVRWIAEKTRTGWGELAFLVIGAGSESPMNLKRVLGSYGKTHNLHVGLVDL